jgi:hypothetical protein
MAKFLRTSASESQDGSAAVVTRLLEQSSAEGQVAGAMFWLTRKKLSGSNLRLISDRR